MNTQSKPTTSVYSLQFKHGIPSNAFVCVPDNWKQTGCTYDAASFRAQSLYSDGSQVVSESELLKQRVAWFRVQLDRFTVRDYYLPIGA